MSVLTPTPDAAATEAATDDGDELTHYWCCIPDTAVCGANLTDARQGDDDSQVNCIVCIDLVELICPHCGEG